MESLLLGLKDGTVVEPRAKSKPSVGRFDEVEGRDSCSSSNCFKSLEEGGTKRPPFRETKEGGGSGGGLEEEGEGTKAGAEIGKAEEGTKVAAPELYMI